MDQLKAIIEADWGMKFMDHQKVAYAFAPIVLKKADTESPQYIELIQQVINRFVENSPVTKEFLRHMIAGRNLPGVTFHRLMEINLKNPKLHLFLKILLPLFKLSDEELDEAVRITWNNSDAALMIRRWLAAIPLDPPELTELLSRHRFRVVFQGFLQGDEDQEVFVPTYSEKDPMNSGAFNIFIKSFSLSVTMDTRKMAYVTFNRSQGIIKIDVNRNNQAMVMVFCMTPIPRLVGHWYFDTQRRQQSTDLNEVIQGTYLTVVIPLHCKRPYFADAVVRMILDNGVQLENMGTILHHLTHLAKAFYCQPWIVMSFHKFTA